MTSTSPRLLHFSSLFFAWCLFFVLAPAQTGAPPSENVRQPENNTIVRQIQEPVVSNLVFPDYVDGGGWSVQLVISNVDPNTGAEVRVEVYDSEGEAIRRFFDSDSTLEIPALGSRVLSSAGSGSIRRGWIEVEADSTAVSGLLTYRNVQSGVEVGVNPVELGNRFALFVEESSDIGTGLAIFKPDASSEIVLQLRDEAGMDPIGRALTRGDFQQRARTIPEWLKGIDPEILRDFRGLLFLRTDDESPFAPLGLRFGKATSSLSAVPAIRIPTPASRSLERSLLDRPDEVSGWQFHPIYLIASDGIDEGLDTSGWIAGVMNRTTDWIAQQTGRRLRVDTYNGVPDVTFVRYDQPEEWFRRCNGVICYVDLDEDYFGIGSMEKKIYVIFFGHSIDDPSFETRASAELGGEDGPGRSVKLPLRAGSLGEVRPIEDWLVFTVAHELFHTLGAVPDCAPHVSPGNHVCDEPDLMSYCMPGWSIDSSRDDYYGHEMPGCWDTEDSPLWIDPPNRMPAAFRPQVSMPSLVEHPIRCRLH